MSVSKIFNTDQPDTFKLKALYWASSFSDLYYFDSNNYSDPYSAFDTLILAGAAKVFNPHRDHFGQLDEFLRDSHSYIPGYFSYDLKNEVEELTSANADSLGFPEIYFTIPEHTISLQKGLVCISSAAPDSIWEQINDLVIPDPGDLPAVDIKRRFSKDDYVDSVRLIKEHIQRGDIYEMNFCQEFYAEQVEIDPLQLFNRLNRLSPTPFSAFIKAQNRYIISATPERFLSRRGEKLISQPIKGTAPRSYDAAEDLAQKERLGSDEKERSENVMIVDLVRNDLTRSAKPGTVRVEELFGIYSFSQVHQMISTVVCDKHPGLSNAAIIANTFPMGSMTGAPKIMAMKLAERYERSKRGVYSGAAGYFAPNGDFDFNVIIRSLLYNAENKYLSFHTGGAITIDSVPENEYEECLLKARAILEVLEK